MQIRVAAHPQLRPEGNVVMSLRTFNFTQLLQMSVRFSILIFEMTESNVENASDPHQITDTDIEDDGPWSDSKSQPLGYKQLKS